MILLGRIKICNMTVVSDSVLCVIKLTVTCLPKTNWGISSLYCCIMKLNMNMQHCETVQNLIGVLGLFEKHRAGGSK